MRSTILSFIILAATSGCWATIPIPYLQFGVPQPQQYFYRPPQRQFPSQPFFPNYEPFRYPQMYAQPQLYTPPHPFVPSQTFANPQAYPFNFYNNPQAAPRDAFPPIYADHDEPVLQYYHRQLPLHPFAPYARKPLLLQRPLVHNVFADCDNIEHQQAELENMQKKMEAQATEEVKRTSTDSEPKIMDAKSSVADQTIPLEVTTKSPSSQNQNTPLKSAIQLQTPAEEVVTKSPNPEPQTTTLNPAVSLDALSGKGVLQSRILQLNSVSIESTNSQDPTPTEVPTQSNDSEPQQSIEIAATKESIPEASKMTNTETKTMSEEEALPQEVQDVMYVLNTGEEKEIPQQ